MVIMRKPRKKTAAELDWESSEIAKVMGNMCGMDGPHPYPWPELLVPDKSKRNWTVIYLCCFILGSVIGIAVGFWVTYHAI